jgi:glycosyltransferase involved in cell wall biosynthesis
MSKKLSICIPTFNRLRFLKKQINFLKSEINQNKSLLDDIDFIVCDNASDDGSDIFLKKLESENDFFKCYVNSDNLGLVGNVNKLLSISKSDFVWFLSDDDTLEKGVLNNTIDIILKYDNLNLIFLNFTFNEETGFIPKAGLIKNSKEIAIEIFKKSYGSLIFISSCIYKRENLNKLSNHKLVNEITSPLLNSFFCCSKGDIFITGKPWVDFRTDNASYAGLKHNIQKIKFEGIIPILESLNDFGYSNYEIQQLTSSFMKNQIPSFILYFFINPWNAVKLFVYFLNFKK